MRVVTLASGSSGNCTLVSDGRDHILIDAGISARRICAALTGLGLTPADIAGIFITHEHGDHISGLKTLTKRFRVPLFAPETVGSRLRRCVPGTDECLSLLSPGEALPLRGLEVTAFKTPHDTPESVGYAIRGSCKVSVCTDLGCVPDEAYYAMEGSALVVLESNHDEEMLRSGSYPYYLKRRILSDSGHLSNEMSARLAVALASSGTRGIVLAHLSRENNTPEIAMRTASGALGRAGFEPGVHIRLETAPQNGILAVSAREGLICSA